MADETKTNATPEAPGGPPPPAPEQTEQAVIPGMDGGPASSGKVIDLSDVRAEAGKTEPEAPPEQGAAGSVSEYTKQEWERPLEEIEAEQRSPAGAVRPRQTGPRRRLVRRNRAGAALPRPRLTRPPARVSGPPLARALPRLPPRRRPRPRRLNLPSPVMRPAPRKRKSSI